MYGSIRVYVLSYQLTIKTFKLIQLMNNLHIYPCHGGLGMECISISSNDMLQLGVALLSYMELLQDSTGKKIIFLKLKITNIEQCTTSKDIPWI